MKHLAVGLLLVLVAAASACGDDETSDRPPASSTSDADISTDALLALDAADTKFQNATEGFQASLSDCLGGGDAAAQACFAEKIRPFERASQNIQTEVDTAQSEASGECARLIDAAEDPLIEFDGTMQNLKGAFATGDFETSAFDDFAVKFSQYRDSMDEALAGCQGE